MGKGVGHGCNGFGGCVGVIDLGCVGCGCNGFGMCGGVGWGFGGVGWGVGCELGCGCNGLLSGSVG